MERGAMVRPGCGGDGMTTGQGVDGRGFVVGVDAAGGGLAGGVGEGAGRVGEGAGEAALSFGDSVAEAIGRERYRRFVGSMARFEVAGSDLRVVVRSEFHKAWLHRRLDREVLETAFERACGARPREVVWEVTAGDGEGGDGWLDMSGGAVALPEGASGVGVATGDGCPSAGSAGFGGRGGGGGGTTAVAGDGEGGRARAGRGGMKRRFALGEFIVGDSNRLAYNAALEMARREPGEAGAAALFLHGDCGVGKTHLLNGVIAEVKSRRPDARVRCVTGEVFANEFIAAVQKQDFEGFRARYRGLELLCIDDVHFIAGKKKTMVELLHTFDALDLDGARVVLASDEHPKRIERLSQRLVSRCVSGMVVRIERPDRGLREKLVETMALRRGLRLTASAVGVVAEACVGSVREIEGAVVRLEAYVRLFSDPGGSAEGEGGLIGDEMVRRALGATAYHRPPKPVRVSMIAEVVCEELGVETSELLGRGRHGLVVLARSMVSTLARDLTTQSYPEIARCLNRKNHSSVVASCQRTRRWIERGDLRDGGPRYGTVSVGELRDRLREEVVRRAAGA